MVLDLTGVRSGRLVAVRRVGTSKHRDALWECKCDCGNVCVKKSTCIQRGISKSCGCLAGKNDKIQVMYEVDGVLMSQSEVARTYGVSDHSLMAWRRAYGKEFAVAQAARLYEKRHAA